MNRKIQEFGMPNEYESNYHIWYSTIGNLGGYIKKCIPNNYLRIKSLNQKYDLILNLKYSSAFVDFK